MDLIGPIVNVLYLTSFLPAFRQADFRSSAVSPCKDSMGVALKNPQGASPYLVRGRWHGTFTVFFYLAARLC
jgi:hypothetical protein